MAAKQIARDSYEQPEPQDEHEHGEGVGHEVGECETTRKQHDHSPSVRLHALNKGVLTQSIRNDVQRRAAEAEVRRVAPRRGLRQILTDDAACRLQCGSIAGRPIAGNPRRLA